MKKLRHLFDKAIKLELVKTSFLSGIVSIIRMITGFVVNKVVAVIIGPSGMAVVSQYQNFITISSSLATGGIASGVVKYSAEYAADKEKSASFLSTSLQFTVYLSVIAGSIISLFANKLSQRIFYTTEYAYLLYLFGGTIILFALNTLLISVLNGYNEIKKFTSVRIYGSILSLVLTGGLCYIFGLKGALIALSLNQAVLFFISGSLVLKSKWFDITKIFQKIDWGHIKNLSNFTFMAMLFGILSPLVEIAIRNYIANRSGLSEAGMVDGINKLSMMYLSMITTTFSVYFLPKFSKLTEKRAIRHEILNGYKLIIPILLLGFTFIYFVRFTVIDVLYTKEFYPMSNMFLPRLIGDFLQMVSWMVAYLMIAKAMVKMMITTQLVFSFITYFLSIFMYGKYGIEGVAWAHAIKYTLYTFTMLFLFKDYLFIKSNKIAV